MLKRTIDTSNQSFCYKVQFFQLYEDQTLWVPHYSYIIQFCLFPTFLLQEVVLCLYITLTYIEYRQLPTLLLVCILPFSPSIMPQLLHVSCKCHSFLASFPCSHRLEWRCLGPLGQVYHLNDGRATRSKGPRHPVCLAKTAYTWVSETCTLSH